MSTANIPIVLAAFGTTTKAMKTYSFINDICKKRFPENPIYWAFSSRIVKDISRKNSNTNMQHPHQVLEKLHEEGHTWAVVQSLHLMCGHEFYRLLDDVGNCRIRTSMGLPLLSEPEDYEAIVEALFKAFSRDEDEALVFAGHGTDHPGWCSYVALDHLIKNRGETGIYVGVVEQGWPTISSVVEAVKEKGFKKVKIVPFMLVAGMHFEEDLSGKENSWKYAFEKEGISVVLESQGMGFRREIVELYCGHIESALDVIPVPGDPG